MCIPLALSVIDIPQWIKDIPPFVSAGVACLALIVSCVHAMVGVSNYRRDRHKVRVDLQWNAEETRKFGVREPTERFGHITVTNIGRRPVSIQFIGLHLPGRKRVINWLATGEVIKLEEGGPPIIKKVRQDSNLEPFVDIWRKIRASADDTANREYRSKHGGERPIIVPGHDPEMRRLFHEPRYNPPPRKHRFGRLRILVKRLGAEK